VIATPAEIAADLREAARIVAESEKIPGFESRWEPWRGACIAIRAIEGCCVFDKIMTDERRAVAYWWPCDEKHRHVRVMALLFAAEFVERP